MGKKAKLKAIRRIAQGLPELKGRRLHTVHGVTGAEIKAQGGKVDDGKEPIASKTYSQKSVIEVPKNHSRAMKQLYYKHGPQGVKEYVKAVQRLVSNATAQKPS